MAQSNIHKMIEKYYDATLSEQEETLLRQMLSQTDLDTEDVREAKATMGLFSTNRKITGKKTLWSKAINVMGQNEVCGSFCNRPPV